VGDRYNIRTALSHYRYLAAFIENAVDAMQWYIDDYQISSEVRSITKSRMETMVFKAHMDKALETYRQLSQCDGNIRPYNVIVRKYIDPARGSDGRGKPFSNEQLADLFDCEVRTIQRDLREAYTRLSILFFGISGVEQEKTTDSCRNRVVVPGDIL
jgi:hypothetical protein